MNNRNTFYRSLFLLVSSFFVLFVIFLFSHSSSIFYTSNFFPFETEEPVSFKMAFVGDIMMDRGVRNVADIYGGYSYISEHLYFLNEFDVVFGNLEGPASDRGKDKGGDYSFRMDPSVLAVLSDSNFSVLSVANNHAGDWGRDAFEDTLERLHLNDIRAVGGGFNMKDAKDVSVLDVEGYKVGFLGFSDIGPDWMEAEEENSGILLSRSHYHDGLIEDSAKEVDLLVVSYHFGEEYANEPNERQRFLATRAIDLGARIVVGHHPHVIQPVEEYGDGIIAYSLGNFIFDQNFSDETMEGLVLVVSVNNGDISYTLKETELTRHFQPKLKGWD